jgi:hypothetical protein
MTFDEVQSMMVKHDADRSGHLDVDEFVNFALEYIEVKMKVRLTAALLCCGGAPHGVQQCANKRLQATPPYRLISSPRVVCSSRVVCMPASPGGDLPLRGASKDDNIRDDASSPECDSARVGNEPSALPQQELSSQLLAPTGKNAPLDTEAGTEANASTDEEQYAKADDETAELPVEWKHLSKEAAQKAILRRAFTLTVLGTTLCLLFSDPMVGVLAEIGNRIEVPPFYVSFVLAPLVSNATELIASYRYALKKTEKAMTISLSIHPGAAVMNNTFVMGIFLLLVLAKSLAWSFAAETICILMIEVLVALMALKRVHTVGDALIILSLYPLSLLVVWSLEKAGLD